jgi:hypothetical protein
MKLYITLAIATAVLTGTVSAGKTSGSAAQQSKKKRRNRKLASFSSDVLDGVSGGGFVKSYFAITRDDDTNFYGGVKEQGGSSAGQRGTLGTAFSTSASVYGTNGSLKLVTNNQRAGFKEAVDIPEPNANFFLQGQCKSTAGGNSNINIEAHSCLYDLCLGGGGFSCINLYSGTPFVFNPPTNLDGLKTGLPPKFDLFILGGTGQFYQIEGTATIETLAGRSAFNSVSNEDQVGTITQEIVLTTNFELPPAP